MGICMSSNGMDSGTEEERRRHREIERQLKEDKAKDANIERILLLGSGDSGKSTIVKQMRIIHNMAFTPAELETYRQVVYSNMIDGLKEIINALEDFELALDPANTVHAIALGGNHDIKEGDSFPAPMQAHLAALWNDSGIRRMYARANEAALPDNFFDDLQRLFEPNYLPNDQDLLHCRVRSTGMTETKFRLGGKYLHMIDVGGQKSERRKWINAFSDIDAILFLVSLNGYDQCMFEDRHANQMQDAMEVWDSICNNRIFLETPFILFFNKKDLFETKVQYSAIRDNFPDYEGPDQDPRAGMEYFKGRFLRLCHRQRGGERDIYTHYTTATNTKTLKIIMKAVEGMHLVIPVFTGP
ncbi:heterotrimeric G protein alpha subunit 4 [Cantharellus anzutake]|uniref:heterotrimeric G protein alpha subunit 4 n=1 Tax=Cantharellus anzutake TaxID=1750568 RepID=UPI001903D75F|nr:heterotrimeric G protein alpha subunit 4 [Cantharellus anzutake]KAF8330345.1 heterotrimeric G protein alpha subunit 4 [Cantharellus anzutake]